VRLGKADSEYTEVLEGLSLDETYVAHNSFILKSDLGKEGAEHED
jgi:cobalt-zinc-cadmium efflux system membrane fusion protein